MLREDKSLSNEISKEQRSVRKDSSSNRVNGPEDGKMEEINPEIELNYQGMMNLMEGISCMTACSDKVDMLKQLEKQFTNLSGYKESVACAESCSQLVKQAKKEIKKVIYKRAQNKKKSAKFASDYKAAGDEFRNASGYQDADKMASECDEMSMRIEKKSTRKRLTKFGAVVICVILVIFGASTAHAKYYLANTLMMTNSYQPAIKVYKKLGAYKDSKERLMECQYQNGIYYGEKGEYSNAKKAFAAAGYYKDSEEQKVKMEKQIIKSSEVGKTVKVGKYDWMILDLQEDKALLMKKEALPGRAYNNNSGEVTWENSTLRHWLNSDFLEEAFSDAERNNIIVFDIKNNDNLIYGTDGGNDTQDGTFLLSIEEVEQYNSLFPTFKNNSWLRSPGYNQSCAAFLSVKGSVMDYGYVTMSEEFTVRPALWIRID